MADYKEVMQELEFGINNGCDYETLEMAWHALKDCRNELCCKCGKYKHEHEGACEGCRWKR